MQWAVRGEGDAAAVDVLLGELGVAGDVLAPASACACNTPIKH